MTHFTDLIRTGRGDSQLDQTVIGDLSMPGEAKVRRWLKNDPGRLFIILDIPGQNRAAVHLSREAMMALGVACIRAATYEDEQ